MTFVSQLGIRYRESPIMGSSKSWNEKLRGGIRATDGKVLGSDELDTTLQRRLRGLERGSKYFVWN
ncbi:uncharacterized protein RAG0_13568 [Rhynchosporium agropyri]|uniref:Uncharacterized protein n=1 Tax=Rhynchosporium agropyri TaxID=914238 RepID=A0A1E1LDC3_9HELO|nr:uncharacterized protein RAG0_13568 [Rhynchosporium agropyri]